MRPLKLFISYAHEDDARREELCKHLTQMKREGLIDPWHDRDITGGKAWAGEIDANLEAADLVLLLISVDFLNSDYCIDVELKRALERHAERQARVVPIILRRCDWQSASFAKLHALPKDGEPLERWPTADTFFTEVARELRRIVGELRSCRIQVDDTGFAGPNENRKPGFPRPGSQAGTWEQARQWLKSHPLKIAAAFVFALAVWGWLAGTDWLLREGDRLYHDPLPEQRARATDYYEGALRLNPFLAEAHFRLGVLSDQAGNPESALTHYRRAVELETPAPPEYYSNLAYEYLALGEYGKAIEIYGRIEGYPLAALESAKAHWALGQPRPARDDQAQAIRWLKADNADHYRDPWYFTTADGGKGIRLIKAEDKRCYARLAFAASLFLDGQEADAAQAMLQTGCPDDAADMKDVVADDLQRYAETVPDLRERSRAFRQRYLAHS
ncbi:TPR repeat-containing protein [Methylomagnum ishizawai]|uniref:TPR repeat-containing protein n=1 Tax=Methylomagnum ishizawai TaxID=1760988 RepID=A0A1Y6D9L8_9GAMM|nr:toll/interleukin-1 receptor domain-containing protein [Methylomagnum ishizawai]SMF96894.1 TPR repeat-containing protein [Methylomagnum ishizawai]